MLLQMTNLDPYFLKIHFTWLMDNFSSCTLLFFFLFQNEASSCVNDPWGCFYISHTYEK